MNLDPFGMLSGFDANWLLLSLIPNAIGLVLFIIGKKRGQTPHLVAGILFMVYPLVATTVTSLIIGGLIIGGGFWYALQAGW